jgi:hypothetical protein
MQDRPAPSIETEIMITASAHPFKISWVFTEEESSAIQRLELVPAQTGSAAYDALISFRSSPDKVYRYEVEDDATAERWNALLSDPSARSATSWGYEVNRARAHGDIVEV